MRVRARAQVLTTERERPRTRSTEAGGGTKVAMPAGVAPGEGQPCLRIVCEWGYAGSKRGSDEW
eukprot:5807686-Prymnesium_polylepis.1